MTLSTQALVILIFGFIALAIGTVIGIRGNSNIFQLAISFLVSIGVLALYAFDVNCTVESCPIWATLKTIFLVIVFLLMILAEVALLSGYYHIQVGKGHAPSHKLGK